MVPIRSRYSRKRLIVAASVAILGVISTAHGSPNTDATLALEAKILHDLASISGPNHLVRVSVRSADGSAHHELEVDVIGSIAKTDVESVVRSAIARDPTFWQSGYTWRVEVTGDAAYATVVVDRTCGKLCGGATSLAFAVIKGQWEYVSTFEETIS